MATLAGGTPALLPGRVPARARSRGRRVLMGAALASLVALLIQMLIQPDVTNIFCASASAVATVLTLGYCFQEGLFERFALSTYMVVGYNLTTLSVPLFFQSMDGKPISYNLTSPDATFRALVAFQLLIVVAHFLYTRIGLLRKPGEFIATRILAPTGFFRTPTANELWVLGGIGLVATWVSRIILRGEVEYGDVGGKFLQSLMLLILVPYMIPFRSGFLKVRVATSRGAATALGVYTGIVLITAMGLNQRVAFASVAFTVIALAFLMLTLRRWRISQRMSMLLVVGSILAIPLFSMAQDLTTAMAMARQVRGEGDVSLLIQTTVSNFNDKSALSEFRRREDVQAGKGYIGYSDIYLESPLFKRLVFTKVTDITLSESRQMSAYQRHLIREDFTRSLLAMLPTPVASMFGIEIDKSTGEYSVGDLYEYLANGRQVGSFLTGSTVTHALDLFGIWWVPAMFLIYVLTFALADSMTLRTSRGLIIAPVAITVIYQLVALTMVNDSVATIIIRDTRLYVQNLVVFMGLTVIVRAALTVLSGGGGPGTGSAPRLHQKPPGRSLSPE